MQNDIVVTLQKCNFCGKANCEAHKKYQDRCDECGRRYTRYATYSSLQRKSFSAKRAKLLSKIEAEYIDLRNAGYKVPRDLQIKRT